MQSSKRQRNRGFLLTDIGRLKLEAARQAAEKQDNQGERYTVEQLSQLTGLDLSTITRVLNISTRVDRRTLERFFQGFNLELKAEDFFKPKVKSNFQLAKDSVVTSVPIYYPVTSSAVYGRERELEQLKNYLLKPQSQRDRTIILYGIGGVGKTAVAVKLVDEVKDDFEFVMVRSLSTASSLPKVLSTILQYFSLNIAGEGFETRITRLISFMQQRRCLLVFDNVETILDSQSCNKSEHSYEAFFSYLSTTIDRSCIILISRARLNTITSIQSRSLLIESLNIEAGRTIIRDRGIVANDEILDETIELYDAHPLSLHLVATTILDIFNGNVREFLAQRVTVFISCRVN